MAFAFRQLTILAPGLLGASLAICAKEKGLVERVHVWARREEVRAKCLQQPWCDAVAETPEAAVQGSDIVVICTPVEMIQKLARVVAPHMKAGAILTDVGSTKGQVCVEADAAMPAGVHFVGSHPMAGSEKSGMEYARCDLFRGRACFVTPLLESDPGAIVVLSAFWRALEMDVVTLPPGVHDEIVANISHLPHFVATIVSNWLARNDPQWKKFAGPGLRDTTRVAAGSPEMWRAISEQNRDKILEAIDGFQQELDRMRDALQDGRFGEMQELFASGKVYRDSLDRARSGGSDA
jgi:cyclohexadieny/prephenate dehydrogenase